MMKRVLIVDDESIVRVALRSLVDWQAYGYGVVRDCMGGWQALEYMRENPVELLVTDMKMPGMDGLELIGRLREEGRLPVTVVLSGYNEFELVREAFRLGVYDYVLKGDLSAKALGELLEKVNQRYFKDSEPERPDMEPGRTGLTADRRYGINFPADGWYGISLPKDGRYGTALFEVADFKRQSVRFAENVEEEMAKPMLELARQIPRMASRAGVIKIYPSQFLLYYRVTDPARYPSAITSLARQIQKVWRDYMNLETQAGISDIVEYEGISQALDQDIRLLKWSALAGEYGLSTAWDFEQRLAVMDEKKQRCQAFLTALFSGDKVAAAREKEMLLSPLNAMEFREAREECLHILCQLADQFHLCENEFSSLMPERVNYYEKVGRLTRVGELELWMNNYLRWVSDYLENCREDPQEDVILRARRFIADNYASPEMSLRSAADYVGLNEKYFSTKFTKETGMTFSAYLTGVRLEKARRLMESTDLKMYEISDRAGYHNVEHFNRMFKKAYGVSPGDYKKGKG